ncbi:hypothetical protein [Teichococcus oryzae]|uniref:Uncharacterized protein n=1 Tax=Teichococcus oryzae TaxID=1608942 RepID=A0A5B2TH83_9PROT|nr:hypothetical protein [Pseudoroseomonas oryzae]KAA2213856.1 hypothetical protein F0Q34_07335 [Pseudoroseomonas oryzae]
MRPAGGMLLLFWRLLAPAAPSLAGPATVSLADRMHAILAKRAGPPAGRPQSPNSRARSHVIAALNALAAGCQPGKACPGGIIAAVEAPGAANDRAGLAEAA